MAYRVSTLFHSVLYALFVFQQLCEKLREKQKLNTTKDELRTKYHAERVKDADSRRQEARIRRDILDSADVVCTTLSGAGSRSLKCDLQRAGRYTLFALPFLCVQFCSNILC